MYWTEYLQSGERQDEATGTRPRRNTHPTTQITQKDHRALDSGEWLTNDAHVCGRSWTIDKAR